VNINWYPGHMKKTKESIQNNLSLVDIVFEMIDARIPYSSRNPIIDSIIKDKSRIIILNKRDLASDRGNKIWDEYFNEQNIPSLLINSSDRKDINKLSKEALDIVTRKRRSPREIISNTARVMIIGIPNVGKSTLINTLSGRKGTKTGNKPGITKSNQWIKTRSSLDLLDTPGILWPKFEDKEVGLNLAFIGSVKDEILDRETLALRLIERLMEREPEKLEKRYNINIDNNTPLEIMENIGGKRGCIIGGGEIDFHKTSNIILDEFRKGIIGKITLELPK